MLKAWGPPPRTWGYCSLPAIRLSSSFLPPSGATSPTVWGASRRLRLGGSRRLVHPVRLGKFAVDALRRPHPGRHALGGHAAHGDGLCGRHHRQPFARQRAGLMGVGDGHGHDLRAGAGWLLGRIQRGAALLCGRRPAFAVLLFAFLPARIAHGGGARPRPFAGAAQQPQGSDRRAAWANWLRADHCLSLATFAGANLEGTFALFSQAHLGFGETEMGWFGVMGW